MQAISSEERNQILHKIADALEANEKIIRTENEADIAVAQEAGYEKSLVARLAIKPGKARKLTSRRNCPYFNKLKSLWC